MRKATFLCGLYNGRKARLWIFRPTASAAGAGGRRQGALSTLRGGAAGGFAGCAACGLLLRILASFDSGADLPVVADLCIIEVCVQNIAHHVLAVGTGGTMVQHHGKSDLRIVSGRIADKGHVIRTAGALRRTGFARDCNRVLAKRGAGAALCDDSLHAFLHIVQIFL